MCRKIVVVKYASPKKLFDGNQINRMIARIAHEILERNLEVENMVLAGLHTRGVPLAKRLSMAIKQFESKAPEVAFLDISMYRDDFDDESKSFAKPTLIPVAINGAVVVLVDDVLYTGRSIRAAMDALTDFGRPKSIQLAVLVDRGHREIPIRADYVGKNIPTARHDHVKVPIQPAFHGLSGFGGGQSGEHCPLGSLRFLAAESAPHSPYLYGHSVIRQA